MRTAEICPDARFAYPEGAYTLLIEYEEGIPVLTWDIIPHSFRGAFKALAPTDYVAYTVLPESE